jgi:hypothetical protein
MKLTKTQQNKIINHARELFKSNTGDWVKNNSIGKIGISPSGALQYKNIFSQGVSTEERPTNLQLKSYIKDVLNIEAYCYVLLMKSYEGDGGIDLRISIEDDCANKIFKHSEKVIEFKDRVVHKVLAN